MAAKSIHKGPLIWIDLEMTGLQVETDVILEIATIVTSDQLEVIAQGPSIVIGQSHDILETMNEWCVQQHTKSGLFQASLNSTISLEDAQEVTYQFLSAFVTTGRGTLCGNSVWQDRAFLQRYMPKLYTLFDYRLIDVSSIKAVLQRWYPNNSLTEFKKTDTHRALPDIIESIEELRHYKTHFFKYE